MQKVIYDTDVCAQGLKLFKTQLYIWVQTPTLYFIVITIFLHSYWLFTTFSMILMLVIFGSCNYRLLISFCHSLFWQRSLQNITLLILDSRFFSFSFSHTTLVATDPFLYHLTLCYFVHIESGCFYFYLFNPGCEFDTSTSNMFPAFIIS